MVSRARWSISSRWSRWCTWVLSASQPAASSQSTPSRESSKVRWMDLPCVNMPAQLLRIM